MHEKILRFFTLSPAEVSGCCIIYANYSKEVNFLYKENFLQCILMGFESLTEDFGRICDNYKRIFVIFRHNISDP